MGTSTLLQETLLLPVVRQTSSQRSWLVGQWRLPSQCILISRIMLAAFIIMSLEAWREVMLSKLSAGVSIVARSIGRLQTLGTLIGVKRVISASSVETTRAASRIKPLPQHLTRSGAGLESQLLSCELVCSRVVCFITRVLLGTFRSHSCAWRTQSRIPESLATFG